MQKNIQNSISELTDLKSGVYKNATQWANMPVKEADIDAAIAALLAKGNAITDSETSLKQARLNGRFAIEQYQSLIEQITSLAEGIHKNEQGKLADYNLDIANTQSRTAKTAPSKAIIESVTDDIDGIGFIVKMQALIGADGFEIEKSNPVDSTLLVLAPPYQHLRNSTKLIIVDDEVEKGKRYFYRERGFNRKGYGEWSEPVSRVQ
jgi:hypothetical protein